MFFAPLARLRTTLYCTLSPEALSVLDVQTGFCFTEAPILACKQRGHTREILGLASEHATLPDIERVNPFLHPRMALGDFALGAACLKLFTQKALAKRTFSPFKTLILHPQFILEGGLTPIEKRILRELCAAAGAYRIYLWEGAPLSREHLLALRFPPTEGRLIV